jgi:hypothetical protein
MCYGERRGNDQPGFLQHGNLGSPFTTGELIFSADKQGLLWSVLHFKKFYLFRFLQLRLGDNWHFVD